MIFSKVSDYLGREQLLGTFHRLRWEEDGRETDLDGDAESPGVVELMPSEGLPG